MLFDVVFSYFRVFTTLVYRCCVYMNSRDWVSSPRIRGTWRVSRLFSQFRDVAPPQSESFWHIADWKVYFQSPLFRTQTRLVLICANTFATGSCLFASEVHGVFLVLFSQFRDLGPPQSESFCHIADWKVLSFNFISDSDKVGSDQRSCVLCSA